MAETGVAEPSPWPAAVFEAPVFRGLDGRATREIESAGRLRSLHAGEVLYRLGEAGSELYVVARGAVTLSAVRRGDDEPSVIRRVLPGESFGEEAVVPAQRRAEARAESASVVAEIPVHLFRRAVVRSGKAELADRLERAMRRAATRDLLRTVAVARDLDDAAFDMVLDAVSYHAFERGQPIYRAGDPPDALWLVAEGRVQLQTEDDERVHVRAYLSRGDLFGDEELLSKADRPASAVASGRVSLLSLPRDVALALERRSPGLFERLRRTSALEASRQGSLVRGAAANATQHVFRDLYRLEVARSLLVIDLEACVRCGHCTWTCGALHGTPRLVRRGDKVVTRSASTHDTTARSDEAFDVFALGRSSDHLMLPNSCQHCENPACMVDCPTGAIGKDPHGEVFIREELCTGCGACARACPWDNIQMATRPKEVARPKAASADDVAVKCDLCRSWDRGPACVEACPTGAIFRIDPTRDLAELRGLFRRSEEPALAEPSRFERAAPPIAGATLAAVAVAAVGATMQSRGVFGPAHGPGYAAGVAAAVGFGLLAAYAVPKRLGRLFRRKRSPGAPARETRTRSRTFPQLVAHVSVGVLSMGLAIAHAPSPLRMRGTTGVALLVAFLAAGASGVLTGLAYAWVPRRLARIERTALLPEDWSSERTALQDRLFRGLTGRSDVVKKIVERILLPYGSSLVGPFALLLSGRDAREERARLRASIDRLLAGRGTERLAGLDELVRIVVELRALEAQRLLTPLLSVGLPLHVATFSIAAVLLVLHLVAGVGR